VVVKPVGRGLKIGSLSKTRGAKLRTLWVVVVVIGVVTRLMWNSCVLILDTHCSCIGLLVKWLLGLHVLSLLLCEIISAFLEILLDVTLFVTIKSPLLLALATFRWFGRLGRGR